MTDLDDQMDAYLRSCKPWDQVKAESADLPRFEHHDHADLQLLLLDERYWPRPRRQHPDDTPEAQAARRAVLARAISRSDR